MNSRTKTTGDALLFCRQVASHKGWAVNPDEESLGLIAAGLARNYNRYGYYLCPCRDGDGERDSDRDIICPCVYAPPDLAEYGHCFCGLFLTPGRAASGADPEPIPERRPQFG